MLVFCELCQNYVSLKYVSFSLYSYISVSVKVLKDQWTEQVSAESRVPISMASLPMRLKSW